MCMFNFNLYTDYLHWSIARSKFKYKKKILSIKVPTDVSNSISDFASGFLSAPFLKDKFPSFNQCKTAWT